MPTRVVYSKKDVKFTLEKKGKDFSNVPGTAFVSDQRVCKSGARLVDHSRSFFHSQMNREIYVCQSPRVN